jgi:hypothetical protein
VGGVGRDGRAGAGRGSYAARAVPKQPPVPKVGMAIGKVRVNNRG